MKPMAVILDLSFQPASLEIKLRVPKRVPKYLMLLSFLCVCMYVSEDADMKWKVVSV